MKYISDIEGQKDSEGGVIDLDTDVAEATKIERGFFEPLSDSYSWFSHWHPFLFLRLGFKRRLLLGILKRTDVDGQFCFLDGAEKEYGSCGSYGLRYPSNQKELKMRLFHNLEDEGAKTEN